MRDRREKEINTMGLRVEMGKEKVLTGGKHFCKGRVGGGTVVKSEG